jgi:DNA repair protein RadD
LIEQNAEKMREHWRGAPLGIYSASLNQRTLHAPITFAGIQSIHNHARKLGHTDLCLIDECHLLSNEQAGTYRKFMGDLLEINPAMRVIGLTATPYRLGQGMLTEGKAALFSDIISPVTVEELVHRGFLAPLRSKHTDTQLDVSGVGKRGGEFIAADLERAVDTNDAVAAVVSETLERAAGRRSVLWFCAGVDHAEHVAAVLRERGESAACITGATPKGERQRIIADFRAGLIRHLTNANVLTTGFDAPDIDCLVMLRPTMSPGLYVQMAGRGMRLKSNCADCLVLDYAGNVSTHGPITCVEPPSKKGKGGEAPTKTCPKCQEIVAAGARICQCGHVFPVKEAEQARQFLHNDDIMGLVPLEMEVTSWQWRKHKSFTTGKEMLTVTYYHGFTTMVTEYLCVLHEGFSGDKARATVASVAMQSGGRVGETLEETAAAMTAAKPPKSIKYKKEGKYYNVHARTW